MSKSVGVKTNFSRENYSHSQWWSILFPGFHSRLHILVSRTAVQLWLLYSWFTVMMVRNQIFYIVQTTEHFFHRFRCTMKHCRLPWHQCTLFPSPENSCTDTGWLLSYRSTSNPGGWENPDRPRLSTDEPPVVSWLRSWVNGLQPNRPISEQTRL